MTSKAEEVATSFEDETAAKEYVLAHVMAHLLPAVRELLDDLSVPERREDVPKYPPGATPALVRKVRWVIKDDDLNLIDSMLEGIKTAASVGFFASAVVPQHTQWGAIAGLFATTFKVARQALKKGTVLSPRTFAVLWHLRECEPARPEMLLTVLREKDASWTVDRILHELQALSALPMNDGTVRPLVVKDVEGLWRTAGV